MLPVGPMQRPVRAESPIGAKLTKKSSNMSRLLFGSALFAVALVWAVSAQAIDGESIDSKHHDNGGPTATQADLNTYQQYCGTFFSGGAYADCLEGYHPTRTTKKHLGIHGPTNGGVAKRTSTATGTKPLTPFTAPSSALTSRSLLGGSGAGSPAMTTSRKAFHVPNTQLK